MKKLLTDSILDRIMALPWSTSCTNNRRIEMVVRAYVRCSTDLQSTENQKLEITKHGFTVDEWYSENGVSGKTMALDRPVFKEMVEKCVAGDLCCVLTLDRLGRNTEDILATIRRFKEKGVALRVMALDGTDLTSKSGKILVVLMSLISELEAEDISTRTKSGMARVKAEGTLLGRRMKVSYDILVDCVKRRGEGAVWDVLAAEYSVDKNTLLQTVKKYGDRLEEYKARWERQCRQAAEKELVI